ncbi:aspartate/glutamate racemase family protein [Roseibaca sp. V10]|uniref:Aspartate/glutamate racemase family protein n=1 Tax=Roseinatronobacter domitianus TaxID=2940293 RepID=A0ABT0M110_9RHOB|nr:aspartate/glutamate racemase family protein [Roseibaca domitiana]MCL1628542.1 aspartate/glutamate racemase family protein [Roseibaca domitiana]
MRLLIINPNSSATVTARINEAAQAVCEPGETITAIRAIGAPDLIVTPQDAEAAERAVTKTLGAWRHRVDGVILASFGDTGLDTVRAQTDVPVVGIAQSAYAMASVLGPRMSIVSFAPTMAEALRKTALGYGHADRLVAMHMVEGATWDDPGEIQHELAPQLLALCQKSAREDRVSSIVLGGGPLAGLAARLQSQVNVPLIDGTTAAIATLRVALKGTQRPEFSGQRLAHS